MNIAYLCGFLMVLVACLHTVTGLTTFGKSQPNNQNQPQPPPKVRGRDCTFETDCAGIQNTSCVPDPIDKKLHCLCGDNKAPLNGQCTSKFKGIRHACSSDKECLEGGACVTNNGTTDSHNTGASKVCRCVEGFVEIDNLCNGGKPTSLQMLLMPSLLGLLVISHLLN